MIILFDHFFVEIDVIMSICVSLKFLLKALHGHMCFLCKAASCTTLAVLNVGSCL